MGRNSRKIKERAIEICEEGSYQETRDEEFDEQFINEFFSGNESDRETLTEDDVQGFMDSFTFPDEDEWCMDKACSEADDWADAKYEEWKDEKMERENEKDT